MINLQIHEECHYMSHIALCVATISTNDKALPDGKLPSMVVLHFYDFATPMAPSSMSESFWSMPLFFIASWHSLYILCPLVSRR